MKKFLRAVANVLAVVGIFICLASLFGRFLGAPTFLGFNAINVYIVGIGFIVMGGIGRMDLK